MYIKSSDEAKRVARELRDLYNERLKELRKECDSLRIGASTREAFILPNSEEPEVSNGVLKQLVMREDNTIYISPEELAQLNDFSFSVTPEEGESTVDPEEFDCHWTNGRIERNGSNLSASRYNKYVNSRLDLFLEDQMSAPEFAVIRGEGVLLSGRDRYANLRDLGIRSIPMRYE